MFNHSVDYVADDNDDGDDSKTLLKLLYLFIFFSVLICNEIKQQQTRERKPSIYQHFIKFMLNCKFIFDLKK